MEKRKDNIVLIGMPGSGKSTIGKLLANELKYNYCDMDIYIEEKTEKSISKIFQQGEEVFRNMETEACKHISKRKKTIISTGGGVVKRKINMDYLEESGIIVFIDRPLEMILNDVSIEERPLLKNGKERLYNLYEERYELYKGYANIIVNNTGYLKDITNDIIMRVKGCIK